MRLTNRAALIAGGASNVGRSVTEVWLIEDAPVVINNIRRTEFKELSTDMRYEGYLTAEAPKR